MIFLLLSVYLSINLCLNDGSLLINITSQSSCLMLNILLSHLLSLLLLLALFTLLLLLLILLILFVQSLSFLLFIVLLRVFLYLFLNVLISGLFIINKECRVVGEQLPTCPQLPSFWFDFLLILVFLFLLVSLLPFPSVFLPQKENFICHKRAYINYCILDLFRASNLFRSSSIFSSILISCSIYNLPASLLSLYPGGRQCLYLHLSPLLGQLQFQPYLSFSTASRKSLQTISDFAPLMNYLSF